MSHPHRYSVRLGRERIDEEHCFECRRCLRMTGAIDGGDRDQIDVHGDLCSECWCHIRRIADRDFTAAGERFMTPRGDARFRREGPWWQWPDGDRNLEGQILRLSDGTTWERRNSSWIVVASGRRWWTP
jgi:hypothetical protein